MRQDSLKAKLVSEKSNKESSGMIHVQIWDKKSRTKRAIKLWASCWGAAAVSVFLPLAHFVLVPALFLAGPIAARFVYGQEKVVAGGEGKCPECGEAFEVAKNSYRFPLSDLCTKCRNPIKVHLVTQS